MWIIVQIHAWNSVRFYKRFRQSQPIYELSYIGMIESHVPFSLIAHAFF